MISALAIARVEINGGTQSRSGIEWPVVEEYADAYRGGGGLPPIVVFYDGERYWLADGFHRVNAAQSAGLAKLEADIRQGTKEDAVWFSCGANQGHGLRRTNADKRRAVTTALQHHRAKDLSDRAVAEHCGVSHLFVANLRKEQVATVATSNEPRTGRDGKSYKPSSEKRSEAAKAVVERREVSAPRPTARGTEPVPARSTAVAVSENPGAEPRAPRISYDAVASAAMTLVEMASDLTIAQQDSIVRLVSHRLGSTRR